MSLGYRTGALSTFPTNADQFDLKTPFNATGSTELADHFNHYFDAALNIETYLKTALGGQIVTYTSKSSSGLELFGGDLLLSTVLLSTNLTSTGGVYTISSTVPTQFGSNPFYDPRFSVAHAVYLTPLVSGEVVKGVTANNQDDSTYLNALMNLPQAYGMVKPTGGTGFDYKLKILPSLSVGSDFTGVFFDNFNTIYGNTLGANWVINQSAGSSPWDIYKTTATDGVLRLWYKKKYTTSFGSLLLRPVESIIPSTTADQEIEFELEKRDGSASWYRARLGPMVRCTGSTASANFYGVALSNTDSNTYTAQLVKILNGDLTKQDSGDTWGLGSGTETDLGSSFIVTTTIQTSGAQAVRYKLTAQGTTISFQQKIGSGGWTTLVSTTDASLSTGRPGFFVKRGGYGSSVRYVNYWIDDVYVRSLDALPASGYKAEVRMLFALTGNTTYNDIGVYV